MILWDINRLATVEIKAMLKLSTGQSLSQGWSSSLAPAAISSCGRAHKGQVQMEGQQASSQLSQVSRGWAVETLPLCVWKHRAKEWRGRCGEPSQACKENQTNRSRCASLALQPEPANPGPKEPWDVSRFSSKGWASEGFACFFGLFWVFGVLANECLLCSWLPLKAINIILKRHPMHTRLPSQVCSLLESVQLEGRCVGWPHPTALSVYSVPRWPLGAASCLTPLNHLLRAAPSLHGAGLSLSKQRTLRDYKRVMMRWLQSVSSQVVTVGAEGRLMRYEPNICLRKRTVI